MKTSRQGADPEWKQLLHLGEQLIGQSSPTSQCDLIVEVLSQALAAQVQVWLASPVFPLPGQAHMDTLPTAEATPLVHAAYQKRQIQMAGAPTNGAAAKGGPSRPLAVAVPLAANGSLLGVVQVERPAGPPFSRREISRLQGLVHHAAVSMEVTRQEWLKNWRYEQLNLVRAVTAQIANMRDPQLLYSQVTALIQQTFDLYYVAIFTLDANDQTLHFRANAGQNGCSTILNPDFQIRLGEGIIGQVALTGQEIIAPDVRHEPRYRHLDALPETLSEAAVPLKVENRILGVLDIQSNQVDAFHQVDLLVLHALADNIALAIESAHLYDDLHRRAEQISSVFEVSHALTSILDIDQLLDEVVNLIQRRFGYPFVHVFTVHPGRRRVIYEAGAGERSLTVRKQEFSYPLDSEKGIIAWVARNGRTMLVNDVSQEPLYLSPDPASDVTRSELTVPLMVGEEVIGVLDIQSTHLNAFDENDRFLFEALAAAIATAMRNANLYRSEQWRRRVAESFRDVAYLITTNHPLNQLLDIILEKLEQHLPCDASAIWLVEDPSFGQDHPDQVRLTLAATRNIEAEKINRVLADHPETQEILNRALQADQPLIRQSHSQVGPLGYALGFGSTYSSIAAPMRTASRPLGIVALAHATEGRYGSEAQAITATFANYAAVAIQNARLYREAQEQALISTMLLQVAEASQSTLTVDDLLATMVRLARLLMGVRKCAFLLWQDALLNYELRAWYGFDPLDADSETTRLFPADLPALQRLAEEKTTLYIEDPVAELNMPEISLQPEKGALVMLPMLVRGELTGALLVALQTAAQGASEEGFDPKALAILQGIAHQTAMTIDNLRLLEARQEEAYVTAALLQVAQAVVSSSDLHDTLDTIVHLLPILVGIDTCVIYLWDPTSHLFRPIQVYAGSRREEETILATPFAPEQHRLLDAVWQSGALHVSSMEDENLPFVEWADLPCQPYDELAAQAPPLRGSWLLAYPLSIQEMVMGVMLVQEKNTSPSFWERRMEIIHGISQQVSLVIQNDIYKQEMVENERIEREVQLARQIQETFLPTSLPRLNGWELDLRWETAREVGGDFYDIFKLDDNRLGMVIADVSDKGLPAALYMTVTRTLIHAYAAEGNSPAQVLEEVNELLLNDSPEAMFITVVYAILSLDTGELVYANAGHNRPLRYCWDNHQVEQLPKGGMALGVVSNLRLENHAITIQPGDALILFTDGVVDILSPKNESFGEERLRQVIAAYGREKVDILLENLDDALADFRQGTRPADDVTLVAIRRIPPS